MNARRVLRLGWVLAGGALVGCSFTPIADRPSDVRATDGQFIHWVEHRIDDQGLAPFVPLRGADGLELADLDGDGHEDIVSVHEDSGHVRVAFAGDITIARTNADTNTNTNAWTSITLAEGPRVEGVEDPALGDLDGDGDIDIVVACESGALIYFDNPGGALARDPNAWGQFVPDAGLDRGSWIRVYLADLDRDGDLEVVATNKSIPMHGGFGSMDVPDTPVSVFAIDGAPLDPGQWIETRLSSHRVPVNGRPLDLDSDGDLEILIGSRGEARMLIVEDPMDATRRRITPIEIENPLGMVPTHVPKRFSGFDFVPTDLSGDGRIDLLTYETPWSVVWLEQPKVISEPWRVHRIVSAYPDSPTALTLVDINGDGRLDLFSGGYSQDPRETEEPDPGLLHRGAGLFWLEQPEDPRVPWLRHDIARRTRGMYDAFVPRDLSGDGLVDFVGTRGNSGHLDGVIWIEQRRAEEAGPRFERAHENDSRPLRPAPAWIRALARLILL